MNTAQLIVVCYAALAVEGVLLFKALDGSASALILAIVVAAAALIYFLKPHPLAKKRRVIAAVILPFAVLATSYYAWNQYQEWKRARVIETQAADYAKTNIPPWFQQQYRQRVPSASWLGMTGEWYAWQQAQEATERAKQKQVAEEAKQRERIAARFKVGDRAWVLSDSYAARQAGYYSANKPRLYGTIVDTNFQGDTERYAIKWDERVPNQITWVTSRERLNPVNTEGQ